MSIIPPHLPSPAPTPDEMQSSPNATAQAGRVNQAALRADLEAQLLKLSQDLYEMEVCAGDVSANNEGRVPGYMEDVNKAFQKLSEMAREMTDTVPRQVIENVDHHRNPHTYTKNALTRATGENQYALGRALGLESFRRQLYVAIGENFPTVPLPERRHRPPERSANLDPGGERFTNGVDDTVNEETVQNLPLSTSAASHPQHSHTLGAASGITQYALPDGRPY